MNNAVLDFAREELNRYLGILNISADIELGLFEDFGLKADVRDPRLDDGIAISVKDKKGYIAGTNERSVVSGVYRLLEEWGVCWIAPGKDGTYYPEKCVQKDVEIFEIAQKRHRTMCIEGAVSLENVIDMVDWLLKAGFNGYYIQFEDAFVFFERWYDHQRSPYKEPEHFTHERAAEYVEIIEKEVKRRGLVLQRMGHGWTCNPFGVKANGWHFIDPEDIPQEYKDICALVNGKREVWLNQPLSTQLCYSDPYVQKTMVDAVVDYAKTHPRTDVIHFWLGDYFNNTCECPECTKYRFSDYQTDMVNKITARFKEEGLKAQVVFSMGYNKAHPPVHYKVEDEDKTILQFAPITRTYAKAFPGNYVLKDIPEYKLNQYDLPHSVEELLAYLYQWKQCYKGDVVCFDYHLMWDHLLESGGVGIARVINEDIRNYDSLGINSFISCQLQRNAFPTSVAISTLGKTLWDSKTEVRDVAEKIYKASFGDEYEKMAEYFEIVSKAFYLGDMRSHIPSPREELKASLKKAIEAMVEMIPYAEEKYKNEGNACRKDKWKLVHYHARIYSVMAESVLEHISGNEAKAEELRLESVRIAFEVEDEIQAVFDCYFYEEVTRLRLNLDGIRSIADH